MKKLVFILLTVLAAGLIFFNINKNSTDALTQKEVSQTIQKPPHEKATKQNDVSSQKTSTTEASTDAISLKKEPLVSEVAEKTSATVSTQETITSNIDLNNAQKVKMKIKAKEKDGMVKAKVAISHDMLTYMQAKKKGKQANFITHITAMVGDRVVYDMSSSQFLSKNPLVKFVFEGKKGEELKIIYTQLKGEMFYASKKIK